MAFTHTPTAIALGVFLMVNSAQAQQAPAAPDDASVKRVQITGSRISLKQAQLSGVGPVTVIDAEAIERSGAISVDTLLQRLPASAGTAGNQTSAYWTGNGYGTTQVNLRGLGIDRTLVLLNGRRLVNGGTGANSAVDLNMIPIALIERVEILKDGASAIYGADAVAGVVNIITKKAIDGVEAAIRYGKTTRGDGDERAIDLAWGTRSERSSLMAALNYSENGTVNMATRAPCNMVESGGTLVCSGSSSTIGGRARLADGRRINFNQVVGGDPRSYETYSSAKHNYNGNPSLNAVSPAKRVGMSVIGNTELSSNTQLFTEFLFTNRQSSQLATPGTLGVTRPIVIAASDPSNPTGQSLTLERRRLAEAGPRQFFQETNTFRIATGLKGTFGDGWDWSTALSWGRNTGTDGTTNVANLDRVAQTMDRSKCGIGPGAAPCGNYLGAGSLKQPVLDYIMGTIRDTGGNDQKSFTANIGGQLFNLPAGPVGFASGVEMRRESGWRNPDNLTILNIANTNHQDAIAGEYEAREVFGELSVPLLAGKPLVEALYLNTALRYSDYTMFGSKSTFKVGLDWQVLPTLKLRANSSSAFRVPNVPELYGGISEGNLTTADPCSGWSSLPSSSTVYINCQASRVPVGYKQLGNTILTTGGGNPFLKPEDARTLTAGAVWTPNKNLTLTVDYFDIKLSGAIESVPGSTKLAVCYNTPGKAHIFCDSSSFTRDPVTGEVNFLSSQPANAASQRVSGIDFGALYGFKLFGITSSLSADLSRLDRFDVLPFAGGKMIEYAGKITGGRGSYTEYRSSTALTMEQGPWSGSYSIQYIGKADDINAAPTAIGARAPALTYHNVQVKYAFNKAMTLSFGMDNVFDRKAPFIQSYTDANTDTMTYDLLGRRWHARIGYRW